MVTVSISDHVRGVDTLPLPEKPRQVDEARNDSVSVEVFKIRERFVLVTESGKPSILFDSMLVHVRHRYVSAQPAAK